MSKTVNYSDSSTFIPSSYDSTNSSVGGTDSTNTPANGLTSATSTTRAAFTTKTTANSTTSIYYNFDCSSIPSNATINSISCDFKATCSSNYFNTRVGQLCTGTTKKGSGTTITNTSINSTVNVQTISNTGTWTRSELDNIKILIEAVRGSSTSAFTISFYGATLTVSYSVNGIVYEVTSTLTTNEADSIDPSGTTDVTPGDDYELRIDAASITNIKVKDNNTDVTSSLVRHTNSSGGTATTDLGTYTLVSGTFNGSGDTYFGGLVGKGENNTTTSTNYYSNGSGSIVVFTYALPITDVPSNATITRVYCKVSGHAESTSNSNEYMCAQLYNGNTSISDELNFKSVGTSNSIQTVEATSLPTVAQLSNLKLQCRLGYYGGAINGATCYVEYTVPSSNQYYWTYTLTNVNADHTIEVYTPSSQNKIYIKVNGSWVECSKVYKKISGSWVEQSDLTNVFDSNTVYIKI